MQTHESQEDYLEAILVLKRRGGVVRAVDVAELLNVSKPSVSKAISLLAARGFVEVVDHDVRLTEDGARIAESILERHVFFSDLLESAGVDAQTASSEACHMEHCLSSDSFAKLAAHLEPLRASAAAKIV